MGGNLSTVLPTFSENLIQDRNFESRGKSACKKVYDALCVQRRDVVQFQIAGSMGKRTDISPGEQGPDFDLVIFLNIPNPQEFSKQLGPPFKNILSEFVDIFRRVHGIHILDTNNSSFISVLIDGFIINIVPAIFFSCANWFFGPSQLEHQKIQTLELICRLSNPKKLGHYYSAGLAQSAGNYVRKEGTRLDAYPLIRLAKFWHRSLGLPQQGFHCKGQSYLIERMALHVVQKMESNTNSDLTSQLEEFLNLMANPSIRIYEPWSTKMVTKTWGADRFDYNFPLVLDPVNPFNNIASLHDDPQVAKSILKIQVQGAIKCLQKLDKTKEREEKGRTIRNEEQIRKLLDQSEQNI